MLNPKVKHDLEGRVREALRERLLSLHADLSAELPTRYTAMKTEEALRQLMVRYRPRLTSKSLSNSDVTDIIDVSSCVMSHATMNDLRFIDALNATYETWPSNYLPEARNEFCKIYGAALSALLQS